MDPRDDCRIRGNARIQKILRLEIALVVQIFDREVEFNPMMNLFRGTEVDYIQAAGTDHAVNRSRIQDVTTLS